MTAGLLDTAQAWLDDDPDPDTRAELAPVLSAARAGDAAALADLVDRFAGLLDFGTAGLRGRIGAGPNRMNRAVVIRAAAGLADYLLTRGIAPVGERYLVAIGFDARHKSREFALDTAGVLTAAGIDAVLMPHELPTPVLSWATRNLPADAGVMVTASHNPPQDNGYKVYLGGDDGGALIVPPADIEIAARIARIRRVSDVPRSDDGWQVLPMAEVERYYAAVAALAPAGPRELKLVATPLHGVGGASLVEVLTRAGFADVQLVVEQAVPDPDFPTVPFPNPEEAGALDLAIAVARERGADLVVANDPDADRCAVAVNDHGSWRMLRGDELGVLLANTLAPQIAAAGGGTLACSIVSSTLLGAIAAEHGLRYERTLTGFKWIARAPGLAYGYEEALGYCVAPDLVHDKDGLSAAVVVCAEAATLKAEGRTLLDVLDDLARRHGVYATDQLSLRVRELSTREVVLRRVLADPPVALGGRPVLGLDDLAQGVDGMPATEGLRLRLPDGWVMVRPSGTEPKLKAYLEVVVPFADDEPVPDARARAAVRLAGLRTDLGALLAIG